ncbi:MAG: TVP38/TMEM64 family protein [Nitrospiraceae bacterium]|nr:TVP38/TMEM64 family protein [Nitrospiraceae bacterium]
MRAIANETENRKNNVLLKIWALVFFLAVTIVLYKVGAFRFFMDQEKILVFLESLGPVAVLGFICLQALQVVAAPIPGEVTGFIGGYLYGPVLGTLFSTIGLTIGSLIAFTLARIFGRPFVDKFVSKATMDKYDYLLHHKGVFLVFLLFLIPGMPKDFLCYILGLGHLTTKEFFVISTVGRFGGTVLLTLGGNYIRLHQYYRFSILLSVAVIIVFLSMVYKDKLESLFHRIHRKAGGQRGER